MLNDQYNYKQHTSNHLMGAGLALGLLVDGLQANLEPEFIHEEQNLELHVIYTMLHQLAGRLVKVAQDVQFGRSVDGTESGDDEAGE